MQGGRKLAQRSIVNEAGALRAVVAFFTGAGPSCGGGERLLARVCAGRGAGGAERVVMVHPARVKAIAAARLKNDRVDPETLAHLSRCNLLPLAWMADEATQQLRLRVRQRVTLGRVNGRG